MTAKMSKPTIDEILAPKQKARQRIYAYSIADEAHGGQPKIGQTTRNVRTRVAEQLKTAAIKNFRIELDEPSERDDGTLFSDHEVRGALKEKGFENTELEWMRCTVEDVRTVLAEIRAGKQLGGNHYQRFRMHREQSDAVNETCTCFLSLWAEDKNSVPRFLWNAKMRLGKTLRLTSWPKSLQPSASS